MNAPRRAILRGQSWAWLLIAFLWVAYFLNYCDRQVVYAIFPVLQKSLGFTNAQLGLTGSLFIWATGVTSPFAGKLAQHYSRRRLITWNLVLWSTVTFFTGLSVSPGILLTGRALLGVTEALFIPLAVSLIGSTLPPRFQSRAVGLFFTAQLCGVVVGGSAGGWISEHFGWRISFFMLGTIGAIFAAPLALFFRDFPEPTPPEKDNTRFGSLFLDLARVPSFVSLCVCFPVFLIVLTIVYAWLANFFHDRFTLGLADAAFRATVYLQSGTALGLFGGSILSDRLYCRNYQARFWLLAGSMIFGAPWVLLLVHGSLPVAQLGAAGFGLANGVFTANIMVAPFDVIPERARTLSIAIINTIAPPFTGLAAFLTGVWKQTFGIANIMSVLAVFMLLFGIALYMCTSLFFEKDNNRLAAKPINEPNLIL